MNKKNKMLAALMTAAMLFSLTACDSGANISDLDNFKCW